MDLCQLGYSAGIFGERWVIFQYLGPARGVQEAGFYTRW